MNEVKRSLNAIAGDVSKDKEELKQAIRYPHAKPKRKNQFPVLITAIVTAALIFFTFNVIQEERSTFKGTDYDINEELYDIQLRTQIKQNESLGEEEVKFNTLQQILLLDSVIEYAKTIGYVEDEQRIKNQTLEEEKAFYETMTTDEKESQEEFQLTTFGITYEDYFQTIILHTNQYEEAFSWLENHPTQKRVTQRNVLDSFHKEHDDVISAFIKKKQIPLPSKAITYKEFEGIVLTIENNTVVVVTGLEQDEIEGRTLKELTESGYDSAHFTISENTNQIHPNMRIKVVFDPLSHPILESKEAIHYHTVSSWQELEW